MAYTIFENALAPKLTKDSGVNMEYNSHMISYNRCNFRCEFCDLGINNFKYNSYVEYTENQFIATIISLMSHGKNFKFSGGEPSLNPDVEKHMQIVKGFGGTIFFDTNGSYPEKIKKWIDMGLIDVLALSFKGLTKEEATKTANIKKSEMCWENVFKTMDYASKSNIKVIVTHVCYNSVDYNELCQFADMLEPYPNVIYKINNLHRIDFLSDYGLSRVEPDLLYSLIKKLVNDRPQWQGRVVYVDTEEGIPDYENIKFL